MILFKKKIILRPLEKTNVTDSGILLPGSNSNDNLPMAEVILFGVDCSLVGVGDQVYYQAYAAMDVEIKGEKLLMIDENDLIGKEEKL